MKGRKESVKKEICLSKVSFLGRESRVMLLLTLNKGAVSQNSCLKEAPVDIILDTKISSVRQGLYLKMRPHF